MGSITLIENITNAVIQIPASGSDISVWILITSISVIFLILSLCMIDEERGAISALISMIFAGISYLVSGVVSTTETGFFVVNNTTIVQPIKYIIGNDWISYTMLALLIAGGIALGYHIYNSVVE